MTERESWDDHVGNVIIVLSMLAVLIYATWFSFITPDAYQQVFDQKMDPENESRKISF